MSEQHYDSRALVALPKVAAGSTPEKGLLSWERPYLFERVRSHGTDVAVVRGAGSLDTDEAVARNVLRPEYGAGFQDVRIQQLGDAALSHFGMLRTIVAPVEADHVLPTLNPTSLRRLARDKFRAGAVLLKPAGMYERGAAHMTEVSNLDDVLDSLDGRSFVAKPNNGQRSQGVAVGDKQAIRDFLSDIDAKNYLIEQKLDFSPPLPGLRGETDEDQARLERANRDGVNKEVRLYSFGPDAWSVVGRVARPGEADFRDDTWLFLDQDSVPAELFTAGAAILSTIDREVGTDDVNIAIDFVYTATDTDPDAKWRVMEVNAAEPQLVNRTQHETIGRAQHDLLARQIARIATKSKESRP